MKNQKLFNETVSILVNAYQKGTLEHGNCYACAVGNIIANRLGYEYKTNNIWKGCHIPFWSDVFMTDQTGQTIELSEYKGLSKIQIDSTGYSLEELASVEHAFEMVNKEGDYMFNGLMAVVDALMVIHEANNIEVKEAKSLFVKETA